MTIRRSRLQQGLATTLLTLVSLVFALVIAEGVCRLLGYGNAIQYRYVPEIGWLHRPNQNALTVGRHASIDSGGLRGPNYRVDKPAGVVRILLLGDSFTFGYGVDDDSTFGVQLQRLLISQFPSCGRLEVLNAGVNGYNTAQEVAFLERVGIRYDPDLVVLGFNPNDIMKPEESRTTLRWPLLKEQLARSALYQFLAPRLKAVVFRRDGQRQIAMLSGFVMGDSSVDARMTDVLDALARLHASETRHGFRSVVAVFPFASQVYGEPPRHWPPRALTALEQSLTIPVIDVLPTFRQAAAGGQKLFLDEPTHHPNALGHTLVAQSLADFLARRRLLPGCTGALVRSEAIGTSGSTH